MVKLHLDFRLDPSDEEYQAIGRFIVVCSNAEITLHFLVRAIVDVDEATVRLLVGEPNMGSLDQLVRKASANSSPPTETKAGLHLLLDWLTYSHSIRTLVAHKPCYSDGRQLVFHNTATVRDPVNKYQYKCSAAQLDRLSDHVMSVLETLRTTLDLGLREPDIFLRHAKALIASARKSDLPTDPRPSKPKTQEPKRPPLSSQGK